MDPDALKRAQERIEQAVSGRVSSADVDAALERARTQVAALAATTAELEASMPVRIGDAVRDGIRAEVRGLMNQLIRRVEQIEGDLLSERHARVDDLSLLVELIAAGFHGVEQRLDRIESKLGGDVVELPLAS